MVRGVRGSGAKNRGKVDPETLEIDKGERMPTSDNPVVDSEESQASPDSEQTSEEKNKEKKKEKEFTTRKPEAIKAETLQKRSKGLLPLRYPKDILDEFTDYLQINVIEYTPITKNSGQNAKFIGNPGSRRNKSEAKKLIRTIILPIPSNVQDGNTVQYEDSRLNGLTGAVATAASDFTKMNMNQLGTDFAELAKRFGNNVGGIGVAQDLFNKFIVSSAAGVVGGNVSINSLLAREQGIIFNPNMELLFNGPTLRSFRFQFKMTPRNEKESQEVKQIIREFKRSMAPKVTTTQSGDKLGTNNLFLRTPDVFELTYKQGNGEHKFLNRFKQCALQDISVNYTAEGNYATYDDGTPVSMIMDLTFKELEPVYDTDYYEDKSTNTQAPGGVGY